MMILDGAAETRWECGTGRPSQQIVVDLGDVRTVSGIGHTLGRFKNDLPRSLRIDVSLDGTTWTMVWSGLTAAACVRAALDDPNRVELLLTYAPTPARYRPPDPDRRQDRQSVVNCRAAGVRRFMTTNATAPARAKSAAAPPSAWRRHATFARPASQPAYRGAVGDFLWRPPSFRSHEDRDVARRLRAEVAQRMRVAGCRGFDKHQAAVLTVRLRQSVRQRLERARRRDRRHHGPAALLRGRHGDALPPLAPTAAIERAASPRSGRSRSAASAATPIITASRTTASILSPFSTAWASVTATRGSRHGSRGHRAALARRAVPACSTTPSNSSPRPLKTRTDAPAATAARA